MPYLLSLVKRSVSPGFIERFLDQRLLGFYALLFNWIHELAYEFPSMFDREATLEWINGTFATELNHYYTLEDSSKTGKK